MQPIQSTSNPTAGTVKIPPECGAATLRGPLAALGAVDFCFFLRQDWFLRALETNFIKN